MYGKTEEALGNEVIGMGTMIVLPSGPSDFIAEIAVVIFFP